MKIAASIVTILFMSAVLCSYGHPVKEKEEDSIFEDSFEDESWEDSFEDDSNEFEKDDGETDEDLRIKKRNVDLGDEPLDKKTNMEDNTKEDDAEIDDEEQKRGENGDNDNSIEERRLKASRDDDSKEEDAKKTDFDLDQLPTSKEMQEFFKAFFSGGGSFPYA